MYHIFPRHLNILFIKCDLYILDVGFHTMTNTQVPIKPYFNSETDRMILSTDLIPILEKANHFLPRSLREAPK